MSLRPRVDARDGLPIVGVPKTIDNDIAVPPSCTFGFDTAVATVTEALERVQTTGRATAG